MFGSLGGPELLLILGLALLLFGPRKIPEIGRALGKTVGEFRKATAEFRATLEREVELEKLKETGEGLRGVGESASAAARDVAFLGRLGIPSVLPAPNSEPYSSGEAEPAMPSANPGDATVEPGRVPIPFGDNEDPAPSSAARSPIGDDPPLG